ncbi:hypothetical protein GPECTOR_53g145 [Gonium pectorale]|uniref:TRP C-terminal domain-containing protein n=1 Tax=Gonium pectorale TaxID=33097 RepID=A0A150G6R6_GONPE|nr:hypothetical protein GPECTOR_53g145 [Gonium pectorale]|eukprot:KXZ45559.1 hypothetical protein GPECTOR_53g145 [Gonium pectorale]
MLPADLSELRVAVSSNGSLLLLNTTTNTSITGDLLPEAYPLVAASRSYSPGPDVRAGLLSLCQELAYEAAFQATIRSGSSGNTLDSSRAIPAGSDTPSSPLSAPLPAPSNRSSAPALRSLPDLVAACSRLWEPESEPAGGGAAPYLQLQCATGYTGPLCAACVPGYYINAEFECGQCPSPQQNLTVAILAFCGGVLLILYTSLANLKDNYEATEQESEEAQEPGSGKLRNRGSRGRAKDEVLEKEEEEEEEEEKGQEEDTEEEGKEVKQRKRKRAHEDATLAEYLKVTIVHAQYYTIITRLPIAYPDVVPWLSSAVSAVTGAENTVAFAYSCFVRGQDSGGQARHQLLGALLVPAFTIAVCLALWALRPGGAGEGEGISLPSLPSRASRPSPPVKSPKGDQLPSHSSKLWSPFQDQRAGSSRSWITSAVAKSLSRTRTVLSALDATLGLWEQLVIVLMVATFILYPGWAQTVLSVFACYRVDDGSGPFPERQRATWRYGYWVRDMAQECYRGPHLWLYVPVGAVAMVLVCLGPPLASFALLWPQRHKLDDPGVRQRYGFLYSRYKRRYFWWESVLMLEELGLVAVEVFGRSLSHVSHQALLMLAVFTAISMINMSCAPVVNRLIGLLEFLSLGVLSLTVILSLYFVVTDVLGTPVAAKSKAKARAEARAKEKYEVKTKAEAAKAKAKERAKAKESNE